MRLKHTHAMLVFGIISSLAAVPFYPIAEITKSVPYLQTAISLQTIGLVLLMAFFVFYPRLRHLPSREDSSCGT
ncbi:MAG: hypothetical protein WAN47_04995 [Nitrosotalea sp.]